MWNANKSTKRKPAKASRTPNAGDAITTKSALAAHLGVSANTVSKYVKRDDWPVSAAPPWSATDLRTIEQWRSTELREDRANETAKGPWSKRLVKEQTLLTRLKRELIEGKYIEASMHEQSLLALVDTFVQATNSLALNLPLALEGLTPAEAKATLRDRFEEAIERIKSHAKQLQVKSRKDARESLPRAGKGRPARGSKASPTRNRRKKTTASSR